MAPLILLCSPKTLTHRADLYLKRSRQLVKSFKMMYVKSCVIMAWKNCKQCTSHFMWFSTAKIRRKIKQKSTKEKVLKTVARKQRLDCVIILLIDWPDIKRWSNHIETSEYAGFEWPLRQITMQTTLCLPVNASSSWFIWCGVTEVMRNILI